MGDAKVYSQHAGKKNIDVDDVKLRVPQNKLGLMLETKNCVFDFDSHGETNNASDGVETEVVSAFHGVGVKLLFPSLEFFWWGQIFESSSHFDFLISLKTVSST